MPRTIEYWTKAWDKAKSDIRKPYSDAIYEGEQAYPGKALNLLSNYAAYSKTLIAFNVHKDRVGASLQFFSRRWGDRYTTQVVDAIDNFYALSGEYALSPEYHSVEFILARVKLEMGNTPLDPNDNLVKILDVIRIKTRVDYASLDAVTIINRYENTTPTITPRPRTDRSSTPSNPRNNITPSLARYLAGFQNKESFSDAFARLEIDIDTEDNRYSCPVSLHLINKPVRVDGILFDYSSLLGLPLASNGTRKHPTTQESFYLDQIQADRDCKIELETLIEQFEVMPKYGKLT